MNVMGFFKKQKQKQRAPCWGFYESLFSERGPTGVRNFRIFKRYSEALEFAQWITKGWSHAVSRGYGKKEIPADIVGEDYRALGHLFPIEYGVDLCIYLQHLPDPGPKEESHGTKLPTDSPQDTPDTQQGP